VVINKICAICRGDILSAVDTACKHFGNHKRGSYRLTAMGATRGAPCPGAEKSQQCRKYFLQYNTFAPERPQVRTWGRQTCFLARAPSNLGAPCLQYSRFHSNYVWWQMCWKIPGRYI